MAQLFALAAPSLALPLLIQFDATFIHLFSGCSFYPVLTSTLITLFHAGLPLRSRLCIRISFFTRLGRLCVYATLTALALSNVIMLSLPGVQASA